jgi:hypothetical protein
MQRAFGTPPIPDFETVPLLYQGASDDFLGPCSDVPLPDEADQIDVEGEFGVIVGEVQMAANATEALESVRLLVQINDWSLRRYGPREMASCRPSPRPRLPRSQSPPTNSAMPGATAASNCVCRSNAMASGWDIRTAEKWHSASAN